MSKTLVSLQDVSRTYSVREGFFSSVRRTVRALDGITLDLRENEILGLVGESGCGKSTLARIALGLEQPVSGRVLFRGNDISSLEPDEKKAFRQKAQMIFQDPFSSLNPKKTIYQTLKEPLKIHGLCPDRDYRGRVRELLAVAGLTDPGVEDRYPHEFSGGQRQRIGLARALATEPDFIIADEPTSALDVSIQAQIINLLLDLQEAKKLTYLFISHDLPVIQFVSNRVAVMYSGQLMELMPGNNFFSSGNGEDAVTARHPYTRYLLSAVPLPDPEMRKKKRKISREQEIVAEPGGTIDSDKGKGCAFAPRCEKAKSVCFEARPRWRQIGEEHFVACYEVVG